MCNLEKSKKLSNRDIYTNMWRCRDFELAHLWQRSAFLGVFIIAVFAGYGAALLNEGMPLGSFRNVLCFVLAILGFILSLFWIIMMKGSKAWYERYEIAIRAFEDLQQAEDKSLTWKTFESVNDHCREEWNFDKCVFTLKGGAFSVSKINIALGHLGCGIWLCAILFHIFYSFDPQLICLRQCITRHAVSFSLLGIFIIILLSTLLYINVFLKSSAINND